MKDNKNNQTTTVEPTQQAVVTKSAKNEQEPMLQLAERLKQYENTVLMQLLQQHDIKPAQFIQIVLQQVKYDSKMQEAIKTNFNSLLGSILFCAEIGLNPSKHVGEFYFIPYDIKGVGMTVTPQIGYKGIVKICQRNVNLRSISAYTVHQGDEFEYEYGLEPKLVHKPLGEIRNYDTLKYVYSIARYNDGTTEFNVMTVPQVRAIQDMAKVKNELYFSKTKDPEMWMAKKTTVKQLSKLLPKDYIASMALSVDDNVEGGAYVEIDDNGKLRLKQGSKVQKSLPASKTNIYSALNELKNDVNSQSTAEGDAEDALSKAPTLFDGMVLNLDAEKAD